MKLKKIFHKVSLAAKTFVILFLLTIVIDCKKNTSTTINVENIYTENEKIQPKKRLSNHSIPQYYKMQKKNSNKLRIRKLQAQQGEEMSTHVKHAYQQIPEWLHDYAEWHHEQVMSTSTQKKYLTIACHNPGYCGGISDRLRSIPYFLFFAHETKRILVIKWQKYDISDFFDVPLGGIDWRIPTSAAEDFNIKRKADVINLDVVKLLDDTNNSLHSLENLVVRSNNDLYQEAFHLFTTPENLNGTFKYIMKILFQLKKPIRGMISKAMIELNIRPRRYLAAHYRAFDYANSKTAISNEEKQGVVNSIHCVIQQAQDDTLPVYFASSDPKLVKYILEESEFAPKNTPTIRVVGLQDMIRYHSDKLPEDYANHPYNFTEHSSPSDLYPAFLDLWLLGESKCVSYGMLGFGKFGYRLAGESCGIGHYKRTCDRYNAQE